jgi:hypothetical protein
MTKKTKEELALEAYMAGLNEKKLAVSDNKIIANSTLEKREKARQGNKKQFSNPEARKKHSEKTKQLFQNPEYKEKQEKAKQEKGKKISVIHTELNKNEEWKNNRLTAVKEAMNTEEAKNNIKLGIENREKNGWLEKCIEAQQNPEVRKKRSESLKNQSQECIIRRAKAVQKPIVTPLGIFPSLKDAGDAYNIFKSFKNGKKYVGEKVRKNEEGFYYISKEEYIMLTGKDS